MNGEIIVTVFPDGKIETKVNGVKGRACLGVDQFLRDALGVTGETRRTAEFYEAEVVPERVKINGG